MLKDVPKRWLDKCHYGDCVELMKLLPSESIDLIVTSPPYNMKEFDHNPSWQKGDSRFTGYSEYHDDLDPTTYVEWQRECLEGMLRVISDDGAIFYNHKWRIQKGLLDDKSDITKGFPVRQIIIWNKRGSINLSNTFFLPNYEVIYLIAKPGFRLSKGANVVGCVWEMTEERNNPHPAPFPAKLAAKCIGATDADVVLDPFMGSGSTAIAATFLNRHWIGMDNAKHYVNYTNKRIKRYRNNEIGIKCDPKMEL